MLLKFKLGANDLCAAKKNKDKIKKGAYVCKYISVTDYLMQSCDGGIVRKLFTVLKTKIIRTNLAGKASNFQMKCVWYVYWNYKMKLVVNFVVFSVLLNLQITIYNF